MNYADAQKAVRAWVMKATGLGDQDVAWAAQARLAKPGRPFCSLAFLSSRSLGLAVQETVELEEPLEPDEDGVGREIELRASGPEVLVLRAQFFTRRQASPDEVVVGALDMAERAAAGLQLESVMDRLNAGGLGVLGADQAQALPTVMDAEWEGRAFLDVRFSSEFRASDFTTYIEEVDAEGELDDVGE